MRPSLLMCPPDFYDVRYVINPWMEGNVQRASAGLAREQWARLHEVLSGLAEVRLVAPDPGSPDMVFAANAGLLNGGEVMLSRFLHPERQREEEHFGKWFTEAGYPLFPFPPELPFEGEGDALFAADGEHLWAGWGWRTSLGSHALLGDKLGVPVTSLRLTDPRFYHLDTCFCPLSNGDLLFYPGAFDSPSLAAIERFYPLEKRLALGEEDAVQFACNAVNVGSTVVLHRAGAALRAALAERGFTVVETPLSEFLKAGGAAKCLVLQLRAG